MGCRATLGVSLGVGAGVGVMVWVEIEVGVGLGFGRGWGVWVVYLSKVIAFKISDSQTNFCWLAGRINEKI